MALAPIPALSGLPLLGNAWEFRHNRLDLFSRTYRECGEVGSFRVGPWPIVLLNAPEYIWTVFIDNADHIARPRRLQAMLEPLIGAGLLNSEGDLHKRQRRLIAPAFQPRQISSYGEVMATYAERCQADWANGTELDLVPEMLRVTLGIVSETLFDADLLGDAYQIGHRLTTVQRHVVDASTSLLHLLYPRFSFRQLHFRDAMAYLDATVYSMIRERRQGNHDRDDVLSLLLRARDADNGAVMTDRQVRDEVMTLFFAGHETMAMALSWSWYLLASHPESYTRLRTEVDSVLAGRTPTVADLPRLPYALQVLKESMRLYPPVYILMRSVRQPIQMGPYALDPSMRVAVSPYVLHRRPDTFPDPERFIPERWTPEVEQQLPRDAYIPFGIGPHRCIGNHFALMEGQLILATLAQHVIFELVPEQDIQPEPLITLRPRGGVRMIVNRRQNADSIDLTQLTI